MAVIIYKSIQDCFFFTLLQKTVEILSKDEEYTMPSGPKQLNTDDLYQV